ncbi:MAG: SIS domain-containing protein [Bdellovibrionales bacterium]
MATPLPRTKNFAETHSDYFFDAAGAVCRDLDKDKIEQLADALAEVRSRNGRLFVLGVGGSAGNAGHAVNDFRKLCGIEAYAPSDNVSELTARANDEGWTTIFSGWLKVSRLGKQDALLVLSVGGGNAERNISPNLIDAIKLAQEVGARVFGIVGREDGYTAKSADVAICIPLIDEKWVTPISEAFQAVVWHSLVSNPKLQAHQTKW